MYPSQACLSILMGFGLAVRKTEKNQKQLPSKINFLRIFCARIWRNA